MEGTTSENHALQRMNTFSQYVKQCKYRRKSPKRRLPAQSDPRFLGCVSFLCLGTIMHTDWDYFNLPLDILKLCWYWYLWTKTEFKMDILKPDPFKVNRILFLDSYYWAIYAPAFKGTMPAGILHMVYEVPIF